MVHDLNSVAFQADWERCAGWLQGALARDPTHSLDEVRDLCLSQPDRYQFWPAKRAAAITQVLESPRIRELHIWLAGGDLREIQAGIASIEAFAAAMGCRRVTILGRPGFARALPGYDVQAVALVKELPHER